MDQPQQTTLQLYDNVLSAYRESSAWRVLWLGYKSDIPSIVFLIAAIMVGTATAWCSATDLAASYFIVPGILSFVGLFLYIWVFLKKV